MWYKIKIFFYSLGNFYRYFSVIYNDRQYDHEFLFNILERKLSLMAAATSKANRYESSEKEVQRMKTCINLIRNLKNDYYGMEHSDYHDTEWEFIPSDECEGCSELKTTVITENFDDYFNKHKSATKRVLKQLDGIDSKYTQAIFVGAERHRKAREILFKILDRHVESWWM